MEYKNFKKIIYKENENKSIPLYGVIEPTLRCNLRCLHCYIPKNNKKYTDRQKELSTKEIKKFLKIVAKHGCLEILFTGGEPFVRKDFLDIYTFAKRLGIICSIYTNGTLINSRIANHLEKWKPSLVEITLYGATAKVYEKITGIPGSFRRCLRGINLLIRKQIPVALKTIVVKENWSEFSLIKNMAKKLNLSFRFSTVIDAKLNGSKEAHQHRIPIKEGVRIELATKKYRNNWEKSFKERRELLEKRKNYLYYCSGGLHTFHLNHYGNLSFCTLMNTNLNIREKPFEEIFYKDFPQIRSKLAPKNYKCIKCKIRAICDQCPARAKLNTGKSQKIVSRFCKYARLRAKYLTLK